VLLRKDCVNLGAKLGWLCFGFLGAWLVRIALVLSSDCVLVLLNEMKDLHLYEKKSTYLHCFRKQY
jgi:chromate transport protein ChrA